MPLVQHLIVEEDIVSTSLSVDNFSSSSCGHVQVQRILAEVSILAKHSHVILSSLASEIMAVDRRVKRYTIRTAAILSQQIPVLEKPKDPAYRVTTSRNWH
jgi:hypothetical protein